MIFCNFRKILMIFPDLGLQCVPQVFNIFEKRILSAQRTFGRSTENDFLGWLQRFVWKKCPKLSESQYKHGKSCKIFEYFLVRGGYVRRKQLKLTSWNLHHTISIIEHHLFAPDIAASDQKIFENVVWFSKFFLTFRQLRIHFSHESL